ncbi:MAG TPA: hypothetical protein PKM25_02195 [Candidatus Ozemobacteraceae bacterium]|nr:hypothetical protein [Candidatus Ozemobacteraceae bacterium]
MPAWRSIDAILEESGNGLQPAVRNHGPGCLDGNALSGAVHIEHSHHGSSGSRIGQLDGDDAWRVAGNSSGFLFHR